MSKTRKKTIILMMALLTLTIVNATLAKANYSTNIVIDCQLDADYSLISSADNYTLYYANSQIYNFIFIEFIFNITGKNIILTSGDFEYDISNTEVQTNFLHSLHDNDTLELSVSRESVGDSITIYINELDLSISVIVPSSAPLFPPEEPEPSDDDNSDGKVKANPMGFFDSLISWYQQYSWFLSIPGGIFFGLFIVFIYRYVYKPIIFIRNPKSKKYGVMKIGRFIENYNAEKPLSEYWILKFKSSVHGIREFYCKYNFDSLREWITTPRLPLEKVMAHIIPIDLELPESLQFPLKERRKIVQRKHFVRKFGATRKDYANWFKYWLAYRIACLFIPSGWISSKFLNSVKYEIAKDAKGVPKKVTKITVLVHEATLKHITTVRDISYQIKTFESGKEESKPMTEKAVPLHYIESLKRDKRIIADSIEFLCEPYVQTESFNDPQEAMNIILSKAELQSIHELELQKISKDLDDTKRMLYEANERARAIKAGVWDQIEKALKTKENESVLTNNENLIQIVSRARGLGELIGDDVEGIKHAIIEFLNKHYAEINAEDRIAVATLKKENEMLKDSMKDLKQLRNEARSSQSRVIEVKPVEDDLNIK